MELTPEQLEKLKRILKIRKVCPNCGSSKTMIFNTTEYQLSSIDRSSDSYTIGGPMNFIPLAAGYCPDCGHTMLFNLKHLGIVEK